MEPTYFLVGVIDKAGGEFQGMCIFTEETPTMSLKLYPFTMYKTLSREDCEYAMNESPFYEWARSLCKKASRGWVRK